MAEKTAPRSKAAAAAAAKARSASEAALAHWASARIDEKVTLYRKSDQRLSHHAVPVRRAGPTAVQFYAGGGTSEYGYGGEIYDSFELAHFDIRTPFVWSDGSERDFFVTVELDEDFDMIEFLTEIVSYT